MSGRERLAARPERYRGESYHGQPGLKAPHWDWTVSGYIALAGAAGAGQALAWIGRLRDREGFAGAQRTARIMALVNSAAGAGLLIADLKTPQRFYNMLRILRPTSPMSFGTYILGAFGAFSAVAALGELPAARRSPGMTRAADLAQAGAALSGAGAATYTAALLSATSNPYWAAAPRALGAKFAASAIASGAAALAIAERLGGRAATARRLEAVAAVATLAHLAASALGDRQRRALGVEDALAGSPDRKLLKAADVALAGVAPLGAFALSRAAASQGKPRARRAALAGSLAVVAGGWLVRHALLRTGLESARRPHAQFRLAQPEALAQTQRRRLRGPQ